MVTHRTSLVSVVVPVRNASALLPRSLGGLLDSDFPRHRWELVVVDDGSTDDTPAIAARYADTVVRLPGRSHGPAYARNRGFEVSQGDIILFIDADVVVHPDTLRRLAEALETSDDIGAVFGSYDARPSARGLMSQYRNLLHHYVHQRNAGDVETFWAGAGAMRREVFAEAGMYDEWHFPRPQIEDIELGARIKRLGCRIVLLPDIQVTNIKRWTLSEFVRTDLKDRGIPWARLLAQRGVVMSTGTLNLRWTEKLNTLLVATALLLSPIALVFRSSPLFVAAAACVLVVLLLNYPLWRFFARVRGVLFALRVMPAHLLHYVLNGISLAIGLFLQQMVGPPLPDPTVDAFAEVGVKRWPPVPTRNRPSSWTEDNP